MNNELTCLPTETVETCVNCTRSDSGRDSTFEAWLCLKPPYQIRKCAGCGLRWLSPRPTGAGYEIVYSADNYFSAQAGADVAYEGMLDARTKHFSIRLSALRDYFPDRKGLKILDYGAATGEFVVNAIKCGHDCTGIEFSADARSLAAEKHGIKLYAPGERAEMNARFDVIHMNHVFEHMPSPEEHLLWCRNRMTKNGLLIIEVPQQFINHIDGLKRLLGLGGKYTQFSAFSLHHTYFFNVSNITSLIERNGFEIVRLSTDVYGSRLGRKKSFKKFMIRVISWLANMFGKGGDVIEVYARYK